ncbi:MAG: YceI family protein [Pseudomonadota bacterium]
MRRNNRKTTSFASKTFRLATGVFAIATVTAGCGSEAGTATAQTPEPSAATKQVNNAPWGLDPENSRVSFVSIKANEIAETHRFTQLKGSVSPDGKASLSIPLDSVETNVDIRNERMREVFFETANFPDAKVTTDLDLATFEALAPGERTSTETTLRLDLHGVRADLDAELFVTRLSPTKVSVETAAPVIVEAASFNLLGGVDKLMELAALPAISPLAPVTVSLVFEQAQ